MLNYNWPVRFCLLLLVLAVMAAPAMAQDQDSVGGVGIVAGITVNPEQFYFGVNVMAAKVATNFWFRPGAEVGVGNDRTLVGINGEFFYQMEIKKSAWSAYFGGGPALMITTTYDDGPSGNNTEVGPGFNFIGGVRKAKGLFSEIKIGLIDSPEFKLGIGYTF